MVLLLIIFTFLIGTCIGSFINAFEWRLKNGKKITGSERSICTKCKKQLAWFHNIPVFSFIALKGKCHFCKEKISLQYLMLELATGALFALSFVSLLNRFNVFDNPTLLPYFIISLFLYWFSVSVLVFVFVYDLKYYLIPDKVSLPAIAIIFILQIFLFFLNKHFNLQITGPAFPHIVLSAIIGGGWFLVQFVLSRGHWVGGGDIRLGVLMGVLLGWPQIILALFLAYILGLIVALPLLIFGKKSLKSQIPFGVFLVPATLLSLFWGSCILSWYLGLF